MTHLGYVNDFTDAVALHEQGVPDTRVDRRHAGRAWAACQATLAWFRPADVAMSGDEDEGAKTLDSYALEPYPRQSPGHCRRPAHGGLAIYRIQ
jgi:hypothetical protein